MDPIKFALPAVIAMGMMFFYILFMVFLDWIKGQRMVFLDWIKGQREEMRTRPYYYWWSMWQNIKDFFIKLFIASAVVYAIWSVGYVLYYYQMY